MLTIKPTDDFDKLEELMKGWERNLPFALVTALNTMAKAGQTAVQNEMRRVFDRPTPYTLKAAYIWPASKKADRFEASIYFRDFAGKGTAAGKYLSPQILGGGRTMKRGEQQLAAMFGLPKLYLLPARGIQLDAYGNPNAGQRRAMLTRLGLSGGRAKASRGKRAGENYFFVTPGTNGPLKPGIYMAKGWGSPRLIWKATTTSPSYTKRLAFWEVTSRAAYAAAPAAVLDAVRTAWATARENPKAR